jgi:hypothetical protein
MEREDDSNLTTLQGNGVHRRDPQSPTTIVGDVGEERGGRGENIMESVLKGDGWLGCWDGNTYLRGCRQEGPAATRSKGLLGLRRDTDGFPLGGRARRLWC